MTDIGPGDLVEAIRDMDERHFGSAVERGARAIVIDVNKGGWSHCCGDRSPGGLKLLEYPLYPGWLWCACGWRKIDGLKEDMEEAAEIRDLEPAS